MKALLLVGAGVVLALVFWVVAMSSGMWGCGVVCRGSVVAIWLSLAVSVYGIVRLWRARVNASTSSDPTPPVADREP